MRPGIKAWQHSTRWSFLIRIRHLHISHNTPCLRPKFCIFHFSWVLQSSQNFGGAGKQGEFWVQCKWRMHHGGKLNPMCLLYWKVAEIAQQTTLLHTYDFERIKIQPLGHDITDKHSPTNFLKITGSLRDSSGSFHQWRLLFFTAMFWWGCKLVL